MINEFENGNVFMIEKNEAIDFIGEVTILAEKPLTSVSIETLTECVVFMISREDFEMWICPGYPSSAAGSPQDCIQTLSLLL